MASSSPPPLKASIHRRTISTFSCDIARRVSRESLGPDRGRGAVEDKRPPCPCAHVGAKKPRSPEKNPAESNPRSCAAQGPYAPGRRRSRDRRKSSPLG